MAHLRFTDVQDRPGEFLDLTSLTLDEFEQLVPPFEAAFRAHMAVWRLDGKPPNGPPVSRVQELPLADARRRLFFLLTYLKTYSLQVVQGRLFGMGQSKANQWRKRNKSSDQVNVMRFRFADHLCFAECIHQMRDIYQ